MSWVKDNPDKVRAYVISIRDYVADEIVHHDPPWRLNQLIGSILQEVVEDIEGLVDEKLAEARDYVTEMEDEVRLQNETIERLEDAVYRLEKQVEARDNKLLELKGGKKK